MIQIFIFALGLGLLGLSFLVVLNSLEQSNLLYPGSNVRFLATLPAALLLLVLCPWFITIPPDIDIIDSVKLGLILIVFVLYGAAFESWFRGGMAKRAMSAVVVDKNGKSISFKRALLRNIFKALLLPFSPICLYLMIKDYRRQALHDKLTGTFVMWSPEALKKNTPDDGYQVEIKRFKKAIK